MRGTGWRRIWNRALVTSCMSYGVCPAAPAQRRSAPSIAALCSCWAPPHSLSSVRATWRQADKLGASAAIKQLHIVTRHASAVLCLVAQHWLVTRGRQGGSPPRPAAVFASSAPRIASHPCSKVWPQHARRAQWRGRALAGARAGAHICLGSARARQGPRESQPPPPPRFSCGGTILSTHW